MAMNVSSHAPVRGHPGIGILSDSSVDVSSHAPVRGHLNEMIDIDAYKKVSSHAPVRGHPDTGVTGNAVDIVSSHAPVRGHQAYSCDIIPCSGGFKSCPREGASSARPSGGRGGWFQVMPP